MLNLPVPKANFHVEKEPSSEIQKEMVQSFADRAAKVHSHMVVLVGTVKLSDQVVSKMLGI